MRRPESFDCLQPHTPLTLSVAERSRRITPSAADTPHHVIQYDSNNYAEVGWWWRGGWTSPKVLVVWSDRGDWDSESFNTLTVNSTHWFKVRRSSASSMTWKWYADGSLKKSRTLSLGHGAVSAQQERNNACDNPDESHWWGRMRMSTIPTYTDWGDLDLRIENDPDYCLDEVSNTEFKVKKGAGSTC